MRHDGDNSLAASRRAAWPMALALPAGYAVRICEEGLAGEHFYRWIHRVIGDEIGPGAFLGMNLAYEAAMVVAVLRAIQREDAAWIVPALGTCGCRILCHSMRPGHIRGSGRRAGPAAEPGYLHLLGLQPAAAHTTRTAGGDPVFSRQGMRGRLPGPAHRALAGGPQSARSRRGGQAQVVAADVEPARGGGQRRRSRPVPPRRPPVPCPSRRCPARCAPARTGPPPSGPPGRRA